MSFPGKGNTKSTYALLRDEKAASTQGGTFTAGDWRTRDLNTKVIDEIGITLSSNQFTLPAGSYEVFARAPALFVREHKIRAYAPAYRVQRHQARLHNVTDNEALILGPTALTPSDGASTSSNQIAEVVGQFELDESKVVELQHWAQTTSATNGFGIGTEGLLADDGEVYSTVELRKVG